MKIDTFWEWDLRDFRKALDEGDLSYRDMIYTFLEHTLSLEPKVRAYLHFPAEKIKKYAKAKSHSSQNLLAGIPVAIKDNICVQGFPTTCGSRILEDFIAPYSATAVRKLEDSGYLFFGKTNLDEFAMGSSTENSAYQDTRNPWDLGCVPGGSSGGSAACVGAGMPFWALGSDTGGSVRQPAGLCGVVGMKPTYGRVSRYGLVAFASSLDGIGVITRRVFDNAVILSIISGCDPFDQTTADVPPLTLKTIDEWESQKKWRIGLPVEFFGEGLSQASRDVIMNVVHELEKYGFTFEEISLPHSKYSVAVYYLICTSEASSNLARYDGVRYGLRVTGRSFRETYAKTRTKGFGEEVKRRIMLGTFSLSAGYYDAYYRTANKARTLIAQDFQKAFHKVDIILCPVSPTPAWKLGEKLDDPLKMYLSDIYTIPSALAGLPGLSLPVGFENNLPVGLQLIGPHFQEERLYQLGMLIEHIRPFYKHKPPIVRGD